MPEDLCRETVFLGAINLFNLAVSAYNAKRINSVRAEQKHIAATVANGNGHHSHSGDGKEVKI